ncbi:unnamed protein product [Prorocentrum cordatum]|uniref:EF-hand domain-containing protein n=1 Tax=Prorocentrum cordatum TaxID=2364126 RepID=A0ABN9TGH8_9DINO|nr:unnamed protein product [Polarella glacialis]
MRTQLVRRQVQAMKPFISDIFCELDASMDGVVDVNEFQIGMERIVEAMRLHKFGKMPPELKAIFESGQLTELFEWIDVDKSGTIDPQEFIDSLSYLALQSAPTETIQILHLLRAQAVQLEELGAYFKKYCRIDSS